MTRDYAKVLADYDLPALLWRLNDACGTGRSLDLAETQEIRRLVERLHREAKKPVKLANVHRVTLFHDGQIEILRRGSGLYGPSAQRRYTPHWSRYNAIASWCYEHAQVYGLHRDATVYRVLAYVPQG